MAQYRLLDTTRLYAFEKPKSSGELQQIAGRHAGYYRTVFASADADSESLPQAEWLAIYERHLDNVRAALEWAYSPEGDLQIAAALTVAVVPLWVHLSLMGECRERVERALAALEGDEAATGRAHMQLSAALGWSLMYGVGRARETSAAWAATLELAEGSTTTATACAHSGGCASINSTPGSFGLRSNLPGVSRAWSQIPPMQSI